MIKRGIDIIVSLAMLAVLSPFLIAIIIILRFTGEGEVFFLQQRMGYGNRPFHITKFVTMLKSAAVMKQGDFTLQNDPRVLPIGRFLRRSKVNELLQFWDVLRGKMSLVGPRPQVLRIHALYPARFNTVLELVRPGITGIGSIIFRDEEGILTRARDREHCYTQEIIPYKADLELWYVGNRSIALDMQLMLLTVWHIIVPDSRLIFGILPPELHRDVQSFGK